MLVYFDQEPVLLEQEYFIHCGCGCVLFAIRMYTILDFFASIINIFTIVKKRFILFSCESLRKWLCQLKKTHVDFPKTLKQKGKD